MGGHFIAPFWRRGLNRRGPDDNPLASAAKAVFEFCMTGDTVIRHIVFFTVPEENRDAVRKGLSGLTAIPHSLKLEIGENVKKDQWGNSVDFIVYGEFENEAALAAYKADPAYDLSTNTVKPLRETRVAADFNSDTAVKAPIR
jgi:quinol monooxygenase YgiN